jgi:hypothetical protein
MASAFESKALALFALRAAGTGVLHLMGLLEAIVAAIEGYPAHARDLVAAKIALHRLGLFGFALGVRVRHGAGL